MAMKNTNPIGNVQMHVVRQQGRFRPNGSSAVDATLKKGVGYTPSRTGAGEYLLTFDEVGMELVACDAGLMSSSAQDLHVQCGDYNATTRTLEIHVSAIDADGALVATDPASDAGTWITFWAEWQNSQIAKG